MKILIFAVADAVTIIVTAFLLFNLLLRKKDRGIGAYLILFAIGIGLSYIFLLGDWLPLIKTMIILGGLLTFFHGTIPFKILASLFQLQIVIVIDFFNGIWLLSNFPDGNMSLIEIMTVAILISLNFLRRNKAPLIEYFNKKYILVWIQFTLNFILCWSVISSLQFSTQMKGLISAILVLTCGISIYFCYYLEKTNKIFEKNLIISKQVEFQENKLEQNKAYLEKNNRLMHDIKKHYLEIEYALSENQLDYVKEYLQGVYQQYFKNIEFVFTGNQVVDSMFFSLKDQCEKEEVDLEYEITIDKKMAIHDQDLAVLLGSLFDRAMKRTNQKEKITVTLKTNTQHLVVAIEYPSERLLKNMRSTKKKIDQWEEIQTVQRIVEKYHGMYEIRDESTRSGMKVILPLS